MITENSIEISYENIPAIAARTLEHIKDNPALATLGRPIPTQAELETKLNGFLDAIAPHTDRMKRDFNQEGLLVTDAMFENYFEKKPSPASPGSFSLSHKFPAPVLAIMSKEELTAVWLHEQGHDLLNHSARLPQENTPETRKAMECEADHLSNHYSGNPEMMADALKIFSKIARSYGHPAPASHEPAASGVHPSQDERTGNITARLNQAQIRPGEIKFDASCNGTLMELAPLATDKTVTEPLHHK